MEKETLLSILEEIHDSEAIDVVCEFIKENAYCEYATCSNCPFDSKEKLGIFLAQNINNK